MQIYWIENKQKHGPIAVPDVITRIQMGELDPATTLGWHTGCEKWVPLRELPALADFLSEMRDKSKQQTEEAEEPKDEIDRLLTPSEPEKASTQQMPSPVTVLLPPSFGNRIIARLTDYAIYAAIFMGICYLFKVSYNQYLLFSTPSFWFLSILIETYLLSKYGATPGKRMMGITVRALQDGNKPSPRAALSRSFGVFILGMGCFIPILAIIMLIITSVMINKGGLTLWENRSRTIALSVPGKAPAAFLCIVIIFISMQIVGYCTLPWIPDLINQVSQVSPELAQKLKELYMLYSVQ
ncbi:MAG: RDD family protein [Akkermansiaceae bacterium]|nr:RDD family protein [Akkermansiaceae bacterium]